MNGGPQKTWLFLEEEEGVEFAGGMALSCSFSELRILSRACLLSIGRMYEDPMRHFLHIGWDTRPQH